MRKAEKILIHYKADLRSALELLEKTRERLLICVDDQNKFVGVLNDGDIRRALLQAATLESSIESYLQKDSVFVLDTMAKDDAGKLLSNRVVVLPVLNVSDEVVGYYSLKEQKHFQEAKNKNVVILGLGYVGLTLALTLAEQGYRVFGYDIDHSLLEKLKSKKLPFYEKGLQKLLDFHVDKNLKLVSELSPGMGEIYIITVGTPLLKDTKQPNLDYVRKAADAISGCLEPGNMVLLRSTLPIGCTREIVLPALEKGSGIKAGEDFHLAFTPERTAEGRALKELRTNPQIVGGFDRSSSEMAAVFFNTFTHSVIHVDNLEAAEFCKLMDNTYRDHKFAFINQMTQLSERLNLDLCELVDAVNHGYNRNEIPKPSPGVAGPCLSKDPYILSSSFRKFDLDSSLIIAARKANEKGPQEVKTKLEELLAKSGKKIEDAKIFLIGLAFKGEPETSDLRDSTSIQFLNLLPNRKNICAYDPLVESEDIAALEIEPVDLENGFKNADAAIILNNHRSYQDINIYKFFETMNRPAVFIDSWHVFDPIEIKQQRGVLYGAVGNV